MTEDMLDVSTEPKRRGRPPKVANTPEPLTRGQAERYLVQILGERRVEEAMQENDVERLIERYRPMMEATLVWEAQPACPSCHARPGYNPITGIRVRSWNAATKSYIDGHRGSCLTLAEKR
jgi:hypothetical protein